MKIAVFEAEQWERESFEPLQEEHEVTFSEERLTDENARDYADAEIVSTFIYSDLSASVLTEFENLKLIATRSTGSDHVDAEHCEEQGITVATVPTYGDNTVAEHVFALLLAISRNVVEAANRTSRGEFSQRGLRGFDLREKTLGIIGTGDIGAHVIRIAQGFGMKVVAFDVEPRDELSERYDFPYLPMEEVLATSDVITLHVPLNDETRHLIDGAAFEQMKDGVVLINTARGSVVDVEALAEALLSGKVAAAGLDVLPAEPVVREEAELLRSAYEHEHDLEVLLANHVLLRMRNVVVTPHTAFNTREAVERILDSTVENIKGFVKGEPENVVVGGSEG